MESFHGHVKDCVTVKTWLGSLPTCSILVINKSLFLNLKDQSNSLQINYVNQVNHVNKSLLGFVCVNKYLPMSQFTQVCKLKTNN